MLVVAVRVSSPQVESFLQQEWRSWKKNIPLDLRKERLNKVLKTMWRSLGSNINEKNASCVANTLEMMEKILESIDTDCSYTKRHGNRNIKNEEAAVTQISSDLMGKHVFKSTPG